MQRISTRLLGHLGLIVALAGCDNPVDTARNNIPLRDAGTVADLDAGSDVTAAGDATQTVADAGDATGTVGDATDATPVAGPCDCAKVGDTYRFTALQLTSVDGNPDFAVIPVLNSLWQSDIDTYELNFIVRVTKVTASALDVVVTNGARVGDTKKPCLMPATAAALHFPRKGCDLLDSDPGEMNVYAGSQQHTKNCGYLQNQTPKLGVDHSIPIRGAILRSKVKADCSAIESGEVVTGSFSKDALFRLCTCQTTPGQNSDVCATPDPKYKDTVAAGACDGCGDGWQSLGGLLSAFAGDAGLQYGCKSDTGGPSVCLTATFKAVKVDPAVWVPADCPK